MNSLLGNTIRLRITVMALCLLSLGAGVDAATWTGGGTSGNWSDAGNWDALPSNGEALVFGTALRQTNTNDLLTSVGAVSYTVAGDWTHRGNPVTLNGNITCNVTGTRVWALDTVLGVTPTVSGSVFGSPFEFSGVLSGSGGISKGSVNSNVKLVISGTNNSYTGQSRLGNNASYVYLLANAGQNSSLGAPTGANATIVFSETSGSWAAELFCIGSTDMSTDRPLQINFRNNTHYIRNNSPGNKSLTFSTDWTVNNGYAGDLSTLYLAGTSTGRTTINGAIPDVTGINKLNIAVNTSGTVVLAGANTYEGTTAVSGGTLRINGDSSAATGAMTVASSAYLGGYGTYGGDITLNNGAQLSCDLNRTDSRLDCLKTFTFTSLSFANCKFTVDPNNIPGGDIVLVHANSLAGAQTINPSSGVVGGRPATLSVQGNDIVLFISPTGTVISIR